MILSCKSWSSLLISELRLEFSTILRNAVEPAIFHSKVLLHLEKRKVEADPSLWSSLGWRKKAHLEQSIFPSSHTTYIHKRGLYYSKVLYKKWMVASSTSEINQQWIVCFYRKWSMHYCYSKKTEKLFWALVVSKVTAVHFWFKKLLVFRKNSPRKLSLDHMLDVTKCSYFMQ